MLVLLNWVHPLTIPTIKHHSETVANIRKINILASNLYTYICLYRSMVSVIELQSKEEHKPTIYAR